ncbi:MAG TPA: VCBS repeat-containing protein [Gemmataceae bacterium]|jgi:hypothetical protein
MFRTWWQRAFVSPLSRTARRRGARPPAGLLGRTTRLSMTALEDRVVPAFNMTLSVNATVGVTAATVATTTTFTATATGANLNWHDVENALLVGNSVVIDSGSTGSEAGNITDQTGAQLASLPGNQSVTFRSGTGAGLVGNITIVDLNLDGVNESVTINANGNVVTGSLTAGTFAAPTSLAGATISAATGSVSQGGPFPTPLLATTLAVNASTGIGTAAGPLRTQVSNLEAQTGTGGIFISNIGDLAIGGVSGALGGVRVTGGSGDIQLVNAGSISVTTLDELVRAPGAVTIRATGAAADLQTGGQSGSNAVRSTNGGAVVVEAGRDILLGNATSFGSVVSAGGSLTATAGRDIIVDFNSRMDVEGGSGTLTAVAGRNVTLRATGGVAGARVTNTGSGGISLTTGAGGVFTLTSGAGGHVQSSGGDITISADDMVISDPVAAGTGVVTLRQAGTTARPVSLGGGAAANALGLSDAELDQVTAGVLRVGRTDNAGDISVDGPVATHAGFNTLSLLTGGAVRDDSFSIPPDITVTNLAIQAAAGIGDAGTFTVMDVNVTTLAFVNSTSGLVRVSDLIGGVTIAPVDTITVSSSALGGDVTALSPLTIAMNVTVGGSFTFSAGGNAAAAGDDLTIATGVTVTLNSATDATLRFEAGDDVVFQGTANVLTTGGGTHTVQLVADTENTTAEDGGTVTQDTAATVSVVTNNLEITAPAGIGSAAARFRFNVDRLTTASAAASQFLAETNGVTLVSLTAGGAGSDIDLLADAGDVTVQTVTAADDVTLTATAGNILDDGNDATVISGDVLTLTAARAIGQPGATPDIDSTVNSLVAATTGAGPFAGAPTPGIWVTDTDALVVTSATTVDGNIVLTSGGTMTATLVTAGNVAGGAARNVALVATAGNILVGAVSALGPNPSNVRLTAAAGAVIDNNGAATNVTAAGLAAQAANGIGSGNSLETAVANFAANNTTAGNIDVVNTGALTITSVGPVVGVTVTGVTNTAPGGAVTVTAQSPLTVAADVTAAGTITLTAGETSDAPAFADDLTVNAGVTVRSTGGDVVLLAGDDVIVNGTAQAAGDVDLRSGFGDTDGEGVIAINGAVTAAATVALNVLVANAGLPAGAAGATEAATASITAAGLLLLNSPIPGPSRPFALDTSTTNQVTTLAASTDAVVNYRNSGALTVGSVTSGPEVVTGVGIFTFDHDTTLCTITGDISLTQAVTAGTGTVRLASAGAVTQAAAGKITATNLGVTAGGDIILDQAAPTNHVPGTVALNTTGGVVRFMDDTAFTVGTVAASGCFTGASGLGSPVPGPVTDVTICSPGNIDLTAPVNATGGTARIQAGGSVTQTAAGTISAVNLGVRSGGSIDLCVAGAPNSVTGTFAADASGGPAGNFVHFLDATGYTVGTVTASTCFTADAVGVRSNNGTIDLVNTAGDLTLLQPVNAGTGTVRLNSAGAVTQTPGGAGAVTAGDLPVVASGNVDLCQVANTVTGNVAVSDTAAGAFVRFLDTAGFTVGTVASDACATGATGVVTNNGDIDLVSTAGPITLNQAVNAGTATVRINSGAAVTQNAAGVITAQNLAVVANGTVNLCVAPNVVSGTFAAQDTGAGALVAFNDTVGFTVGAVTADVCAAGATGVTTNNGDVDLVSGGAIVLAQPVNAGAGTVRINAGGAVTQTAGGAGSITAANLAARANGNVDLCQVANTVPGTFAASVTVAGAFVRFLDTTGFTVGTVAADACALGATGVVTTNGDISLVSQAGPITLTQAVNAGTATVRINSGGAVTQTGGGAGAITATDLAVVANGNVDLCQVVNNVTGNFAAADTGAGAFVRFLDGPGFTVGAVTADVCAAGATGVVTNNGDASLASQAGPITLAQPVNAGTATVRLATGGAVTQTPGGAGAVTAGNLSVFANGNVDLCQVANTVTGTFAAFDAAAGAFVRFLDTAGFTVGTVAGDPCAPGADGVTTSNGDASLVSQAGPITLARPIDVGTATVRLATGGAVTQTPGGAGSIRAQNLAVVANGNVDLCQVSNTVAGTFAANDSGPGAFVRFLNGPAITIGTVTSDVCAAGAAGVTTNNGDVELVSTAGPVSVTDVINTRPSGTGATTATVRLNSGAAVTQTAVGVVATQDLAVRANGNVDLSQANNLVTGTFAARDTALGAAVRFRDASGTGLIIGTIADGVCALGATGILTNDGNVTVRNDALGRGVETLNIVSPITVGTATVRLHAGGNVVQDPNPVTGPAAGPTVPPAASGPTTGAISASALAVSSTAGSILLDRDNFVSVLGPPGAFAASAPLGNINFRNVAGLILTTVTADPAPPALPPLFDAVTGVSTGPTGTVRLQTGGGLTQAVNGPVVTGTLGVRNTTTGDVSLITATNYAAGTGNDVRTFAGFNSAPGGRMDFATLGAVSVGTVAADGTFALTRGITTTNGGSNLRTGTDFSAVDHNFADPLFKLGNGNFLLNPGQTPVPAALIPTTVRTVTFDAEAQTTGLFRFGVPTGAEAPAPGVPTGPTNPTGPASDTSAPPAPDNPFRETFNIRPSANVQVIVNGNLPTTAPGDSLFLILTDLPPGSPITFTPGGPGAGRYDFPGTRRSVAFTGIETLVGQSVFADSVQTGPGTYTIVAGGFLQGRPLTGGITGGQAPANPFIVSPNLVSTVSPFGPARITFGDFNGDGTSDLIIGNGPNNNGPIVTVVTGTALFGSPHPLANSDIIAQFFAYDPRFQGGVFVAAGDFNGDGRAEVVTGADAGGGPHVRAFTYAPGGADIFHKAAAFASPLFPAGGFFAYAAGFTGGARVAVGDVNGDGTPDLVTGAGPGGGPHVKVFNGATGGLISQFFAYAAGFTGGVYVGAGDYNLDGKADVLTGAGNGGGPHVKVYSGASLSGGGFALLTQFFAFGPDGTTSLFGSDLGLSTGVGSLGLGDVDGDGIPDILVSTFRGPRTRVAAFHGNTATPPPRIRFSNDPAATFPFAHNPNPTLFAIDPATGDLIIPSLRDGSNLAALFATA